MLTAERSVHLLPHTGEAITLEAFLALPEGPPYYEMIRGILSEMAYPTTWHQLCQMNLISLILFHLAKNPGGKLLAAPVGVRLDAQHVFLPDLLYISDARLSIITSKEIIGAPDLVAEILSPSTVKTDVEIKMPLYALAGVRELWLIDPDARVLTRYDNQDGAWHITATLSESSAPLASAVLAGLEIGFGEVFGG
jgi:Uma2 family endonuclease